MFEWYRDFAIEDDDEVAVSHGPAESDYMVASEPMVNIRQTLKLAQENSVVSQDEFSELISQAKSTFYKKRNWEVLLSATKWATLLRWVKINRVNLKKEDAIVLLQKLVLDRKKIDQPFKPNYQFEWTNVWDAAYRAIKEDSISSKLTISDQLVLAQLKLEPARYHKFEQRAVSTWLSNNPNKIMHGAGTKEALKAFRAKNNLMTRAALLLHMHKIGLNETDLTNQMEKDGMIIEARKLAGDLSREIIFALQENDNYSELLQDGKTKKRTLEDEGISISTSKVKRGSYLVWYFERVLGMEVPYNIEQYAMENGFKDVAEFDQTVMQEYLYQRYLFESQNG